MENKWLYLGIGVVLGIIACHYVTVRGQAVVSSS
jgi:hypothetical protein